MIGIIILLALFLLWLFAGYILFITLASAVILGAILALLILLLIWIVLTIFIVLILLSIIFR